MLHDISNKDNFKYNSGTGDEIVNKILKCDKIAPIFFYKPFNPFTKAMGYSDGKAIYLNSRKFKDFSFNDLVGLLCHEYLHMVGFSHGNNYKTEEKCLYSVNYFVSENMSKWI
jgi:predicted metallopeptidase